MAIFEEVTFSMEDNNIRRYATLMCELGLTGLEIRENGSELRLERTPAALESAPAAAPATSSAAAEPSDGAEALSEVASPMVGVFYRAAAENVDPYVHVGDAVKAGDVLCIIESMKLMNEIESEFDGEIIEILIKDGEPVEYGKPLFKIK